MNIHFKEYLEIFQKFPIGGYFSKEQRKIRHTMMTSWEKEEVKEVPTLTEFIDFVKQHQDEIQITPQFFKKFQTVWQEDAEQGYRFPEFLFRLNLEELMWNFDISSVHLAERVLKHDPNHPEALRCKLNHLVRYHDFCLHELPWGVLTEASLEEEMTSVAEMERIAEALSFRNENFEELVSQCKTYYPLWYDYLKEKMKYPHGFPEFLVERGIDIQKIFVPYVLMPESSSETT